MLKKKVTYVDFNQKQQDEVLYFNLTEAEIVRLDLELEGGMEKYIESLDEVANPRDILNLFEKVLKMSYGEKSEDGKYFIKDEEQTSKFGHSAAYSALFVELVTDADAAASFFTELMTRTTVDTDVEVPPKMA